MEFFHPLVTAVHTFDSELQSCTALWQNGGLFLASYPATCLHYPRRIDLMESGIFETVCAQTIFDRQYSLVETTIYKPCLIYSRKIIRVASILHILQILNILALPQVFIVLSHSRLRSTSKLFISNVNFLLQSNWRFVMDVHL